MKRGGHAAAKGAFRGSAKLSNLIDNKELAMILGDRHSSQLWIKIPQPSSREDRFLSMLEIKKWTTQDLIDKLSEEPEMIETWLKDKSDKWHQGLYALLGDFLSNTPRSYTYYLYKNHKDTLSALPIVRLSDGTYRKGEGCYFPSDDVEHDKRFPRVAKSVYSSGKDENQQKDARKFLEEIGVREVGEKERIDLLLRTFYDSQSTKISDEQHLKHMTDFIKW